MSDDVDITTERDEREYHMRLAASRRDEGRPVDGSCHWCATPVPPPSRFCDRECQIDHGRTS